MLVVLSVYLKVARKSFFKSTLSYQVIGLSKDGAKVIESGLVERLSKRYKVYDIYWDRKKREYCKILRQGEKDFDVKQASLQATCRASLLLVNKLANAFPIIAKTTDWADNN